MPNSIERARRAIAEALRTHPATLSLRGDGLTELPDELWSLVDLEWLDLGDNQLTQLDPRIASFKAGHAGLTLQGTVVASDPIAAINVPGARRTAD